MGGVNAIGKGIRECQAFLDAIAVGFFEKKTITEYAQGAMRSYFHNTAFTASLKNDPAFKIPAKDGSIKGGSGAGGAGKGGSVKGGAGKGGSGKGDAGSTTTIAAFHSTLVTALRQARQLGMVDQAADLLDFLLEAFDGFSETETETETDFVVDFGVDFDFDKI